MTTTSIQIPEWADKSLSRDLSILRSQGESQEMEYKEKFPEHVDDLAKEIAAFASTNAGTILIGVADSGDLVGLPSCQTTEGRDQIMERLAGISRGTVKPAVTPTARFAVEGECVVLVIAVPRGTQPIYYCKGTPYIRHLTSSKPAEPHEVIEKIAEYLGTSSAPPIDAVVAEKTEFYSALARILFTVLIYVDEFADRKVNPWLDMWRAQFKYAAGELRELMASNLAVQEGIDVALKGLADQLDLASGLGQFIGGNEDFPGAVNRVGELASELMHGHVDPIPLLDDSLSQVTKLIRSTARQVEGLSQRAEGMAYSGRLEELQSEASKHGLALAKVSYYNIEVLGDGIKDELRAIGHRLHLIETVTIYMDGGASIRALIECIEGCADSLKNVADKLPG